jgi:hypothetical protein
VPTVRPPLAASPVSPTVSAKPLITPLTTPTFVGPPLMAPTVTPVEVAPRARRTGMAGELTNPFGPPAPAAVSGRREIEDGHSAGPPEAAQPPTVAPIRPLAPAPATRTRSKRQLIKEL